MINDTRLKVYRYIHRTREKAKIVMFTTAIVGKHPAHQLQLVNTLCDKINKEYKHSVTSHKGIHSYSFNVLAQREAESKSVS